MSSAPIEPQRIENSVRWSTVDSPARVVEAIAYHPAGPVGSSVGDSHLNPQVDAD